MRALILGGSGYRRTLLTLALVPCACGPGTLGADSSDQQSSSSDSMAATTEDGPVDGSSDSSNSSESTGTEEMGFVPALDIAPDSCDPWAQDCLDGEKCVPYSSDGEGGSWDLSRCVPILGNQGTGDMCIFDGFEEATDNCDGESYCWNVIEENGEFVGICHAFCQGNPDEPECPPMSECQIASEGAINLCIPICDPIAQDCGAGLACHWTGTSFNCLFAVQDTVPLGQPCGFINDCAPGAACLPAEVIPNCGGSACCGAYCDLNLGDEQCAALPGTTCVPFFPEPEAPAGYEHIGVCILPP